MPAILKFLILLAATICFGAAALNVSSRVNLIAAGLLLWVITALVPAAENLH